MTGVYVVLGRRRPADCGNSLTNPWRQRPGWNIDTLRHYLERLIAELDRRLEQRFLATEQAVRVAFEETQRWRESANEWRAAMNDQRATQIPRAEVEHRLESLLQRVMKVEEAIAQSKGRTLGLPWLFGGLGLLIGLASLVYAIATGGGQ